MRTTRHSSKALTAKVNELVALLKEKGYAMNRRWSIKTTSHIIRNTKMGGQFTAILDIDNKWKESQGLTVELVQEAINELNSYGRI